MREDSGVKKGHLDGLDERLPVIIGVVHGFRAAYRDHYIWGKPNVRSTIRVQRLRHGSGNFRPSSQAAF